MRMQTRLFSGRCGKLTGWSRKPPIRRRWLNCNGPASCSARNTTGGNRRKSATAAKHRSGYSAPTCCQNREFRSSPISLQLQPRRKRRWSIQQISPPWIRRCGPQGRGGLIPPTLQIARPWQGQIRISPPRFCSATGNQAMTR